MSNDEDEPAGRYASTDGIPVRERVGSLAAERRLALDVLTERTTPVDLGELATAIVVRGEGTDASTEAAAARVKLDLHHVHLPKLDEAGVIDYDPESCVVRSTDESDGADEADAAGGSVGRRNSALTVDLRAHVVEYFDASASETASLDDLARYARTRLSDSDSDDWPAGRVELQLHHVVLPGLADTSHFDYDPRTHTVRYRTNPP